MSQSIALAHATGFAAEAILEKLPDCGISPDRLVLLDHESKAGKRIAYGGRHLALHDQQQYDLSDCALLLLPQADPALEAAALQQGCLLLGHAIEDQRPAIFIGAGAKEPTFAYSETRLRLASPELACLLPSLVALNKLAEISRLQVTLLRSAEFFGKAGVDELASQAVNLLNARPIESRVYPQQIAFNLIPEPTNSAFAFDIQHFLGNSSYPLSLQTVNVPLFHGFAAAVQLGFASPASMQSCSDCLSALDNMTLTDADSTPISDCNQSFGCVISQLEQAPDQPPNLQFWMVTDPMRYGLANNYVNVLDFLLKSFL
jgi:aspartate-semialdehyde dehydrogenase